TLEAAGQAWLEDPSNVQPVFARGRLRRGAPLDAPALAQEASAYAARRAEDERRTAAWLAVHARIDPAGFLILDPDAPLAAPSGIRRRALRQILRSVGGLQYPPREARLDRLLEQLGAGLPRGRTLGGCRILPWRGAVLVCREPRAIRDERLLESGAALLWDGRFRIELHGAAPALVV